MENWRLSLDTSVAELRGRASEALPLGANAACGQSPVISGLWLPSVTHLSHKTVSLTLALIRSAIKYVQGNNRLWICLESYLIRQHSQDSSGI